MRGVILDLEGLGEEGSLGALLLNPPTQELGRRLLWAHRAGDTVPNTGAEKIQETGRNHAYALIAKTSDWRPKT